MSPEARITEKKKAMTLQQTKNLFHKKEIVNKMQMQPTKGEKIFVNDMSDKEGVDIQNIQRTQTTQSENLNYPIKK